MKSVKSFVKGLLRQQGYELIGRSALLGASGFRAHLLEMLGITLILDVGANEGQYGTYLRSIGYRNTILSFEPMGAAFEKLRQRAALDTSWQALQLALGEQEGTVQFNIAGNSQSSSILPMLDAHQHAAPESAYIGTETVRVRRLDAVYAELARQPEAIFLKIDTQGFERQVLAGASSMLGRVKMLELEVSLVHLYKGDVLFSDMHALVAGMGFKLLRLDPGFTDPKTGALLQADAVFVR